MVEHYFLRFDIEPVVTVTDRYYPEAWELGFQPVDVTINSPGSKFLDVDGYLQRGSHCELDEVLERSASEPVFAAVGDYAISAIQQR